MRPLLVGEAPSRTSGPDPLSGACGARLAGFCSLSAREFGSTFDRANVLATWPGSAGKGSAFPLALARERAAALRRRFRGGRTVILLGRRVARAFGLAEQHYFEPVWVGRSPVFVVPHPSGVNAWFNDPAHARQMRMFLAVLVRAEGRRKS